MMRNTASVAAGAPQTASSTYAGWWSSPEPMLLPCMRTRHPPQADKPHQRRLYEGNRVRVAGQGVQSEWFCIRTGVRQGCPLSPLLFNIFMDFLAHQVIEACEAKGVHGFKVAFRISGQVSLGGAAQHADAPLRG